MAAFARQREEDRAVYAREQEALQHQLADLRQERDSIQATLHAQQQERERDQVAFAQQREQDQAVFSQERDALQRQLSDAVQELVKERQDYERDMVALMEQQRERERDNTALAQQRDALQQQLGHLQEEREREQLAFAQERNNLKQQLASLEQEHVRDQQEANAEREENLAQYHAARVSMLKEHDAALLAVRDANNATIARLQESVNKQVDELQGNKMIIEEQRTKMAELILAEAQAVEAHKKVHDQLLQQTAAAKEQERMVSELKATIAALTARLNEQSDQQEKEKLAFLQEQQERARDKAAFAQQRTNDKVVFAQEQAVLQLQLTKLQREHASDQAALLQQQQEREREQDALTQQLVSLQQQLKNMEQKQLDDKNALQNEQQKREKDKADFTQQLMDLKQAHDNVQAALKLEKDNLTTELAATKALALTASAAAAAAKPPQAKRVFALLGRQDAENEAAGCCQPRTGIQLQDLSGVSVVRGFVAGRLNRAPQGMALTRVQLVCDTPEAEAAFCHFVYTGSDQRNANLKLRPPNPATAQFQAGLERLRASTVRVDGLSHCQVVLAWHGPPAEHALAVCRDRPRSFRTTDGGFFGAGSYFALESEYAMKYARMGTPNADGEYAVILFAVYFSCAYVVTEADYTHAEAEDPARWGFSRFYGPTAAQGVALMPGYDAHFIPVRQCGTTHPFTGATLPHVDYQAADASAAEYHELVVQTHHQAIPLAVAWFK